ncbi:MAG: orotidine-5'-phosphate decarboxylase [Gammaproteobacteria bacterium]|nr:orotidine-5'-phosphate decarboxylase [Gammaproteobacteria bacterium]MDH5734812.1 orotidine-5'-phosphate decarboxylase [Gammaproteobacteria bacterium]
MSDSKIIVALDFSDKAQALELISKIDPALCRLKVGKEMFTHYGPAFVEEIQYKGFEVFLDLKYHDIPNTVARACDTAADLGVWMLNVHALGGRRMMEAASEALIKRNNRPKLIAVTVLTSMSADDLNSIGISLSPADYALQLANLAKDSGLDGIVCSAQESASMKRALGSDFILVTPGIRPSGSANDDQRRIMTPADAISAGSDYLVIGRPITQSEDPIGILRTINSEIS